MSINYSHKTSFIKIQAVKNKSFHPKPLCPAFAHVSCQHMNKSLGSGWHSTFVLLAIIFFKTQLIVCYKNWSWEHDLESISGSAIVFEVSMLRALKE